MKIKKKKNLCQYMPMCHWLVTGTRGCAMPLHATWCSCGKKRAIYANTNLLGPFAKKKIRGG